MGLLKSNNETYTCKLCDRDFVEENYNLEFGICNSCLMISGIHIDQMTKYIPDYQEKANSASNPSEKIVYLSQILDLLYKYKFLYAEKDVNIINRDIDVMISDVIDCISEAKL